MPSIHGQGRNGVEPRMTTAVLTYLQQHYFSIITFLIFAIIVVSVFLFMLLISIFSASRHAENDVMHRTKPISIKSAFTPPVLGDIPWGRKKSCSRIHCSDTSCKPKLLSYEELRPYTCCGCYDERFDLKRFQWDSLRSTLSLYFQVPEVISGYSPLDLAAMKKLPGLDGSWNLVQEDETAWYFKYENVKIVKPPCQD